MSVTDPQIGIPLGFLLIVLSNAFIVGALIYL